VSDQENIVDDFLKLPPETMAAVARWGPTAMKMGKAAGVNHELMQLAVLWAARTGGYDWERAGLEVVSPAARELLEDGLKASAAFSYALGIMDATQGIAEGLSEELEDASEAPEDEPN
jgi:hypothetical protein